MHQISGTEIDAIAGIGNSIHLTFFGISLGSLVSLGGVLLATPPSDPRKYATLAALTALSFVLSIVFGINAWLGYRKAATRICEIKAGSNQW